MRPVPQRLVQPDRVTCGAAVLVMARALHDPGYASWLQAGGDARWTDEVWRTHRRTNDLSARLALRDFVLPWPRRLGTPPWAAAAELRRLRLTGRGGVAVRGSWPRGRRGREALWRQASAALASDIAVPLYVGTRLLPRHVVLLTDLVGPERLRGYDPAHGATFTVTREAWLSGRLARSGWNEPWWVLTPAPKLEPVADLG